MRVDIDLHYLHCVIDGRKNHILLVKPISTIPNDKVDRTSKNVTIMGELFYNFFVALCIINAIAFRFL